jgi:hypothetical protein
VLLAKTKPALDTKHILGSVLRSRNGPGTMSQAIIKGCCAPRTRPKS